jgi:hypothetical protein
MSHTMKRNFPKSCGMFGGSANMPKGRNFKIRKTGDNEVGHSGDCWLCLAGTKPKRMFRVKPRRRLEKREALREIADELSSDSSVVPARGQTCCDWTTPLLTLTPCSKAASSGLE